VALYSEFVDLALSKTLRQQALDHARKRTRYITRQFIPRRAPLTHLESNYVGALGELAVRQYLGLPVTLPGNYDDRTIDAGDLTYNGLVYDVKTEAVPTEYYHLLRRGEIQPYEPYGCRVWTTRHWHHLKTYTGGLIFCALEIPAKLGRKLPQSVRPKLLAQRDILILGFVPQAIVKQKKPTWYTPPAPEGKRRKYNSENLVFHHSELVSIEELL
jgi:hypothetical protein